MRRFLVGILAFVLAVPIALADQLPPPKKPSKPPEYFRARRAAQAARKQASIQRMQQFKTAQAVAEQKAYQDWHERYTADAPVRIEYYRALARAYEADTLLARPTPYFYAAGPPVIYPMVPVYFPAYYPTTIYATNFWGW